MNIVRFLIGAVLPLLPLSPQEGSPAPRMISFGGEEWTVKRSEGVFGPGPNHFSDSMENVFVDKRGCLHLRITFREGQWRCAEIISKKTPGYGTYRFDLASSVQLDPQIVWGFFTWQDTDTAYHNREFDIEFGRWGQPENQNTQYVVQPYTLPDNIHRFAIPEEANTTTHRITWQADSVAFLSARGTAEKPKPADILQTWTYYGKDVPQTGGEHFHINLWLLRGKPPTDGKEIEVVIQKFRFSP